MHFLWVGGFSEPYPIRVKFSELPPTPSLEAKTIISFKNFFLPKSQVSFGNGNATMVKQFHQLDQCQL